MMGDEAKLASMEASENAGVISSSQHFKVGGACGWEVGRSAEPAG